MANTKLNSGLQTTNIPPQAQLDQMITGYWTSQAIYAAAKFGIADLLTDGPKSVDELATATDTKPELLYRLLRALASVGIFAEEDNERFSLTPLAEPLRSGIAGSQRSLALMMGDDQYRAWGHLADTVQTGDNAYEKIFGKPIFDHLAEQPEKASIFDDAMTGIHGRETGAILDAYDFAGINVIADIGGGNGSKITAILPPSSERDAVLLEVQITTHSTMGAVAYETGGILVDDGWLRFLGSGHPKLTRTLPGRNRGRANGIYLIADDVVGGFFAMNGGAFDGDRGDIWYWAPDSLEWESLDLGYTDLLQWSLTKKLAEFYAALRWPTWKEVVAQLVGDRCFSFYPFLWTTEGSVEGSDRRAIPVTEAFDLKVDLVKQLQQD